MKSSIFGIILLTLSAIDVSGQKLKSRPISWIPSLNTRVNGLAIGFMINSLKETDSVLMTEVNGLSVEILGAGFFLPVTPGDPFYSEVDMYDLNGKNGEVILKPYHSPVYKINGISIAGGGTGGHDITVNGLNLGGVGTLTGKMNGFSAALVINMSGIVNGVSIAGLINNTIQTKGVQIGLVNKTSRLRGFQFGLWNRNEKRQFPIINWSFK
ncbi:MAG TPA: hypothetical protein VFE50_17605 [Cyclobacteriaceae bacterium]|nr:hypothetical protein [Cyclobacteriaceae bacterium]